MQVEQFLEKSACLYPQKTALVCGDDRFTYDQLEREANRLAHALIEAGVRRGDRVVVLLPNSVEAVLSIFAILKAGAVFVVLNCTTKAERLVYILNNCRAAALIIRESLGTLNKTVWDSTPHLGAVFVTEIDGGQAIAARAAEKKLIYVEEIRRRPDALSRPANSCIDVDLAALIYTSGSTGQPKGVMLTHLNIVSAATSITTYLENTADEVVINFLPLSFDYGLYQVLMTFKVGGTLVLEDSFAFPHLVLEKICRQNITGLPIVPMVAALLLQMDLSNYSFPKLRYITNTGSALPVEHIQRLRALFPQAKLYSMYGLTECKRVSYLPPDQLDRRPTSVGRGMPNEEVYIVGEEGRRASPGTVGELVIRGSNVMKGYWESPEETARCLKPGPLPGESVLYSGDLFRADEEGYLYFVGRKDDIIKSRGEKVSPREVEDVIYTLEGVAEVAVIGVPDPILGSKIKAVLTLRPGAQLTSQDVLRHCATRLVDFMRPKLVEFRDSLPKTESGKINKRLLAEQIREPAATNA